MKSPGESPWYIEWLKISARVAAACDEVRCIACGQPLEESYAIDNKAVRAEEHGGVSRLVLDFYCPGCHLVHCAEKGLTVTDHQPL